MIGTTMLARLRDRTATHDGGFTLLETLGVMTIVGLLAAFAAPQISRYKQKETISGMRVDMKRLMNLVEASNVDLGRYPTRTSSVVGKIVLEGGDTLTLNTGNVVSKYTLTNATGAVAVTPTDVAAATDYSFTIQNSTTTAQMNFNSLTDKKPVVSGG